MQNNKVKHNPNLVVLIPILLVTLVFQIIHLPPILSENRPNLLLLVLIFFSTNLKSRFTLEITWIVGILLDLLSGMILGVNALILCFQVYIISTRFQSFRKYKLWQQFSIVAIVHLLTNAATFWLDHLLGRTDIAINILGPSISTAIFWPVAFLICKTLCIAFSIDLIQDKEELE